MEEINTINCYCDASTDPLTKLSIGAFKIGNKKIRCHLMKNTSNTDAEIRCIMNCINYCQNEFDMDIYFINIHTDCQKAVNTIFKDHFNIIKVKGHQPKRDMNEHDLIFKTVDKYARKILRSLIQHNPLD